MSNQYNQSSQRYEHCTHIIDETQLQKFKHNIPFVTGFALQNYLPAESSLVEASKNGYHFWYVDCSSEHEKPNRWGQRRVRKLLRLINEYSVSPIFHGNFKVPLASDVEELRKASVLYVKKEIELAAKFNAPLILHGGAIVEPRLILKIKKIALENYLKSLETLKTYADQFNVPLYLENLSNYQNHRPFHYIFTHKTEIQFILNKIDLPLFLEMGHANIGENPLDLFNVFHTRIVGMSFSNNDGVADQHLGLSCGSIDYKPIITSILKKGWRGCIAFETRGKAPFENIIDLNIIFQKVENEI